ncbi:MAG: hypothetical protein V1799_12570 [bacterium]
MNLDAIFQNYPSINRSISAPTPFPKPVLFIRGGESGYILDSDLESIRTLFPQANVLTIPKAGHWVHADAPDELYRSVLQFLL